MKHAYLILAHSDKLLLERLVAMLDDERNDIYIHIDKKSTELVNLALQPKKAELHICKNNHRVYWGDISQIEAELKLFAMAYAKRQYAYYHIISGSDLPIKSQDDIHTFFDQHQGVQFISYWSVPGHEPDAARKVLNYHFGMRYEKVSASYISIPIAKLRNVTSTVLRKIFGERSFPWSIKKGTNWMSITHDCVGYILSHQAQIRKHFKHTRCGDEIFIQSLLWDSPFREQLYKPEIDRSVQGYWDDEALREIHWAEGANSPNTWQLKDLDTLLSSPNLFARKFSSTVDADIIEEISRRFG